MRDFNRIDEIIEKVSMLWKKNPDMRFYQLMVALANAASNDNPRLTDLFYLEDDRFLITLNRLLND